MLGWIVATGLALAEPYTAADELTILQLEAQRSTPIALQPYLTHEDPRARARAARALGRLRTSTALSPLRKLIDDPDPTVRAEAAFALGQTPGGGPLAQDRYQDEQEHSVQALLCEAMGKQGGSSAVPALVAAMAAQPPLLERPRVAIAAARAIGILARKEVDGVGAPVVLSALLRQLDRGDAELRRAAAYALSQLRPPAPPADIAAALMAYLQPGGDSEIRKLMLYATADLTVSPAERDRLYGPLLTDSSTDVRIALARVSGRVGWKGAVALLEDRSLSVRLEAIEATGKIEGVDHGRLLLTRLQQGATLAAAETMRTEDSPALLEAAAALVAIGSSPVEGVPELLGNANAYLQAQRPGRIRVAAAGLSEDGERLLGIALDDSEIAVRTAAAFRLTSLEDTAAGMMRQLLGSFDPIVVAIGADWLAEHPARASEGPLLDALEAHEDLDVIVSAASALLPLYTGAYPMVRRADPRARALTAALLQHEDRAARDAAGELAAVLRLQVPAPQEVAIAFTLDELQTIRQARIHTARGMVIIDLYPEEAPLTVWNFTQLAESGFYDGLAFHRVIPDFVVQDGDPRGDGTGGPGWTIPDEINPLRYAEGALGMAHAGPDTGGSQWFITLSAQPHLDGIHTVFGRVHRGQHVLRDIRPGDRIDRIVIERVP